jgi:hypothetical protein
VILDSGDISSFENKTTAVVNYILYLALKSLVTDPNLMQVSEVIFMSCSDRNEDCGDFKFMA